MLRVREFFAGPDITLVGCGQHQFSFLVGSANIRWVSLKSCPFEWPRTWQHLLFSLLAWSSYSQPFWIESLLCSGLQPKDSFQSSCDLPSLVHTGASCTYLSDASPRSPFESSWCSASIVSFLQVTKIPSYFLFWKTFKNIHLLKTYKIMKSHRLFIPIY